MKKHKKQSEPVIIKPHHFLDIIKLYGGGYEKFTPDKERGHDFWKVGNQILENSDVQLELTLDNDAICDPCQFNGGFMCTDMTSIVSGQTSKDQFNKRIDRQLFNNLGLNEGATISAIEFCKLAKKKLKSADIMEIWKEKPVEETKKRVELLSKGMEKYIKKYGGK